VVSAVVGSEEIYLQTTFPRYVRASKEVVRIPRSIVERALGSVLTVRIRATKKHKVADAYLFEGEASALEEEAKITPLHLTRAFHRREKADYGETVAKRDGTFLHTIPGDVVELEMADVPRSADSDRYYLLRAHGFYSKMSEHVRRAVSQAWYRNLDGESRRLLRNLRVHRTNHG
jgi:hypothetical protein